MPEPVYTDYDNLHVNTVGLSVGLYCCAQTSVLNPNNPLTTGKLSSVSAETWKKVANVAETSIGHDTQTDEAQFYDEGGTNSISKVSNTISLGDHIDLTLVNQTPLFEAMVMGVPDPFNTDCGVDKEVPIFATSEPYADLCFKLVKKVGATVYKTEYFYGRLHIPDAMTYNGKFQQPKVRIDVQRCVNPANTVSVSTTAFTGQTAETEG